MRISTIALTLAAVSLVGCALPPAPASSPAPIDVPLQARLMVHHPSGGAANFSVSVNQPAHVAVFEVRPGQGAALLYPRQFQLGERVRSGISFLPVVHNGLSHSGMLSPVFGAPRYEPRYFLLIASKTPLQVEEIARSPIALRRELGIARFASHSAWSLMDDLVDRVLPAAYDDEWAADVYVQWPEPPRFQASHAPRFVLVACPGGTVLSLAPGVLSQAGALCARAEAETTRPAPADSARPKPADTTSAQPGTPRTPRGPATEVDRPRAASIDGERAPGRRTVRAAADDGEEGRDPGRMRDLVRERWRGADGGGEIGGRSARVVDRDGGGYSQPRTERTTRTDRPPRSETAPSQERPASAERPQTEARPAAPERPAPPPREERQPESRPTPAEERPAPPPGG